MRVRRIWSQDPEGRTILDYQYAYDRMDNITIKQTEHGTYQYAYDVLYRLIRAGNPTLRDEAFTYDSVGNRLTSADTAGDWRYNPNNELGGYHGTSFLYDENGDTVQRTEGEELTRYQYNVENRLVRVEDGSDYIIAEYNYDPFGRRLWKEIDGERTCFVYSDEGLVGEGDDTGSLTRSYGYVPDSPWTTDPLFLKENGQYYFYQNDHLGTPQKMTASNGSLVWSAKYSSFGKAQIEIETVESNLRFPGQYLDLESGLHYNYHRCYKPELGRYLRPDPISFNKDFNFYYYVSNEPVKLIDPKGLVAQLCKRAAFTEKEQRENNYIPGVAHCYFIAKGKIFSWHPSWAGGVDSDETPEGDNCTPQECTVCEDGEMKDKRDELEKCIYKAGLELEKDPGWLWAPPAWDCCDVTNTVVRNCKASLNCRKQR